MCLPFYWNTIFIHTWSFPVLNRSATLLNVLNRFGSGGQQISGMHPDTIKKNIKMCKMAILYDITINTETMIHNFNDF